MNKKNGSLIMATEIVRLGINKVVFNCTKDSHNKFIKDIGGDDYLISNAKMSKITNTYMYLYLGITFYFIVND